MCNRGTMSRPLVPGTKAEFNNARSLLKARQLLFMRYHLSRSSINLFKLLLRHSIIFMLFTYLSIVSDASFPPGRGLQLIPFLIGVAFVKQMYKQLWPYGIPMCTYNFVVV